MQQENFVDISTWDEACLRLFIQENSSVFRVFTSRFIKDFDVIDDVLQEAYIKLWINRGKIGVLKSPRNYFFTIIKHVILDRKGYLQVDKLEHDLKRYEDISDDEVFFRHIIEAECSDLIAKAIMVLSPQSQKVILMSLDGESMKTIAAELGITINTVKTIKYRALERLGKLLSREDF